MMGAISTVLYRAVTARAKNSVTSSMKILESAPFQLGSLSGKSCPISGRLKAPRMESTMLVEMRKCIELKTS
jgi:hypothetical protein